MSPDRQLLLACCRAYSRPPPVAALTTPDVDWDRLLQRAERLGVAALLHTTLTRCVNRARLPPDLLPRLDHGYYQQALRNARLGASLADVLAAFARSSVPVVVLKGAAIAEPVYGNIALRRMTDLDLLVRFRDLDVADRLVRDLGYVPDAWWRSEEWYRRHHHHLVPYRAGDGSSLLELHHHIFPPNAGVQVAIEDLWDRARPAGISSGPALALAPADLLLHLGTDLSAVQHFHGGLLTLCDIAAVIQRYSRDAELDWSCLLRSARGGGLEKHLYYAFWLARSLVGADVPGHVLEQLERSAHRHRLEDQVVKSLAQSAVFHYKGELSMVPPGLAAGVLAELLAPKNRGAKLGGLLRLTRLGLQRLPVHLSRTVRASLDRATRPLP